MQATTTDKQQTMALIAKAGNRMSWQAKQLVECDVIAFDRSKREDRQDLMHVLRDMADAIVYDVYGRDYLRSAASKPVRRTIVRAFSTFSDGDLKTVVERMATATAVEASYTFAHYAKV